ncbi:MAG: DNA double-strand break repair nuclease NurA [Methanobacteriota archaeon]
MHVLAGPGSAALSRSAALIGEILSARDEGAAALAVERIPEAPVPGKAFAIDGSSAVLLEGNGIVVGAIRAGTVVAGAGTSPRATPADLRLVVLTEERSRTEFRRAYEALVGAAPAREPRGAADALEGLRTLAEYDRIRAAISEAVEGDVVLVDGALARAPVVPAGFVQDLGREASVRGVVLAGVVKGTSLALPGGAPAMLAAARAGLARHPRGAFAVELSAFLDSPAARVFAARLAPTEARLFRVDLPRDATAPLVSLARIGTFVDHPGYAGYPYPLALVHNAVTITEEEQHDLASRLRAAALEAGVAPEEWERVFADFHDELDLGA